MRTKRPTRSFLALAVALAPLVNPGFCQDSPDRVAELRAALHSEKAEDRIRAANELATMGSAAEVAIPDLAALVKDKDAVVRTRAVIALRNLATPGKVELLPLFLGALEDTDPAFRVHLDRAIVRYGKVAASPLIEKLTSPDTSPNLRTRVLNVLALLGADARDAIPTLSKILEAENIEERLLAAHALGRIGPHAFEAQKGLILMLDSKDRRQIIAAAESLQGIKAAALKTAPSLLANFKHEDPEVRWNCAFALGLVDPSLPDSVALLVKDGGAGLYRAQSALLQLVLNSTTHQGHLELLKASEGLNENEKKLAELVFKELERRSE